MTTYCQTWTAYSEMSPIVHLVEKPCSALDGLYIVFGQDQVGIMGDAATYSKQTIWITANQTIRSGQMIWTRSWNVATLCNGIQCWYVWSRSDGAIWQFNIQTLRRIGEPTHCFAEFWDIYVELYGIGTKDPAIPWQKGRNRVNDAKKIGYPRSKRRDSNTWHLMACRS